MTDGLYIGLISGTSMDGVDAALVRFERDEPPRVLDTLCNPIGDHLRESLAAAIARPARLSALDLARLDMRLGEAFAAAALELLDQVGVEPAAIRAIGCHGQTVYHGAHEDPPISLQIGNPALIARRTGIDVVADFRAADLVAGGQAAPLAPALHAALLRRSGEDRAVLNLGGIANLTWLPADPAQPVRGFDTGPANCLMDDWARRHLGRPFDRDGAWAASAEPDDGLLRRLLDEPYFALDPPKSTGRETFNLDWLEPRLRAGAEAAGVQATLCELTVRTVADGLGRLGGPDRVLVCGGGVENGYLMARLGDVLAPVPVESTAGHGLDPHAVESLLFAWLARRHLAGEAGNLPEVTGAAGPRVLGALYPR